MKFKERRSWQTHIRSATQHIQYNSRTWRPVFYSLHKPPIPRRTKRTISVCDLPFLTPRPLTLHFSHAHSSLATDPFSICPQNSVHNSCISSACYVRCPSNLSLYHPNNIWRRLQATWSSPLCIFPTSLPLLSVIPQNFTLQPDLRFTYSLCLTGRTECEGCTIQTVKR